MHCNISDSFIFPFENDFWNLGWIGSNKLEYALYKNIKSRRKNYFSPNLYESTSAVRKYSAVSQFLEIFRKMQ